MVKQESPTGQPESKSVSTRPSLERIFGGQNEASIIAFDPYVTGKYESSVQELRNHSVSRLIGKYRPVFEGLGRIRTAGEEDEHWIRTHDSFMEDSFWSYPREYEQGGFSFARPGASRQMLERIKRRFETGRMAALLFSPSTEIPQIQERQQVLGNLAASPTLDEAGAINDNIYRLVVGMSLINRYYRIAVREPKYEDHKGEHTKYFTLFDLHRAKVEKIPIFSDYQWQIRDEWCDFKHIDDWRDVQPLVDEATGIILDGIKGIQELDVASRSVQDPVLQKAVGDLAKLLPEIGQMLAPVLGSDITSGQKSRLKSSMSEHERMEKLRLKLQNQALRIGSVLEFARKIRDEGWGEVTFDDAKAYGYTGGWSLDIKQEGQVHNDGPYETPVVLLSGANTSGKSFAMNSDFLIRIAAQSLGFAPVVEGNFPVVRNFIYTGRTSTDPENDLSAYMREVKNWISVISAVGPDTILYSDEGYSTTSPQDQARLLPATAAYITSRAGRAMLATHNDILLARAESDSNTEIYHLRVKVGKDGKLIREFILEPGANDSLAVPTARASNFPEDIVVMAERYLEGNTPPMEIALTHNYPEVKPFSDEERAIMKLRAETLDFLFKEKSTNALLNLFSRDSDFSSNKLLIHLKHNLPTRYLSIFEHTDLLKMLGDMVLNVSGLSPAQILERQRMFSELANGQMYKTVQELIASTWFFEETFTTIASYMNEGIGLNFARRELLKPQEEEAKKGKDKKQLPRFYHLELKAAIAFLQIQQKVLGDNFVNRDLLTEFTDLEQVFLDSKAAAKDKYVSDYEFLTRKQNAKYEALFKRLADIDDAFIKAPIGVVDLSEIREQLSIIEDYLVDGSGGHDKYEPSVVEFVKVEERRGPFDSLLGFSQEDEDKRYKYKAPYSLADQAGLPFALQFLPDTLQNLDVLLAGLRASDSVYLNQAANYLEQRIEKCKSVLRGEVRVETPKPDSLGSQFMGKMQTTEFTETVRQLDALCLFAQMIEESSLAPVDFNSTGQVQLSNAFSLFKSKNEQTRNSLNMSSDGERVELLTGPNGSGKTFFEKDVVTAMLMAHATGFAPADIATMPIFDAIAYLDRVVDKEDLTLSSHAQDLEYWKRLLNLLQTKRSVFAVVDEAFSATSPNNQAAFTYGAIAKFLQSSNHYLIVSTHNHDLVDRLLDSNVPLVRPYHFRFDITPDKKVDFLYQKQEGHETSHAIEVARTMGLPEEITSTAK